MATAAGTTIGALRVVIGADTTGLSRGMRDAQGGLEGVRKTALPAMAAIAALGAAAAATASKLISMARDEMKVIDAQAKLSRSIGGTVTGLRALNHAANLAGVDGLEGALARLNRRLGAAEMGVGPAADSVKRLGLNIKELANLDADAKIARIADQIKQSGVSSAEAARHLQNLGFQQQGVTELFLQGGDAIRSARGEVEKFGAAVSQADAEKIEQTNDAFTRVGLAVQGIRTRLAVELTPVILKVAERFEKVAAAVMRLTPYVAPVIEAFMKLAEAAGVALVGIAAFYAPAVLAGIGAFTTAVGVGAVGAVRALTAAIAANPIGAILTALVLAGYAAYKFRDQIQQAIGDDATRIIKNAANIFINSFVVAYEDIKFVWNNFGNMMGASVVGGVNLAITAINKLIEGSLSGINSMIAAINNIPGVDIGKIGDGAKIELLDNQFADRLITAVKERNQRIAAIMSTDRFADAPGGMVLTDDDDTPGLPSLGSGGSGKADKEEEKRQKELERLREHLEQRLEVLREFTATEMEMEVFKHEKRLEDLRELWEEGIIPTEEEFMELREDLEAGHWERINAIRDKANEDNQRNIKKWADFEIQQRRNVASAAVGFLDQLAGKSKAAAIAAIALNKGLAIAQIIQNTAAAQMRAMAELGPLAGPPAAAKIGVMGAVQAGIVAATGLAQAAGAMSGSSGSMQGGASGSIGGRSSAPSSSTESSAEPERLHSAVTINLVGESYSRQQVRDLIEQINEATADGAQLRLA